MIRTVRASAKASSKPGAPWISNPALFWTITILVSVAFRLWSLELIIGRAPQGDTPNYLAMAHNMLSGRGIAPEALNAGWGGRIRTCECRYQKPVPYHLATPQHCPASGAGGGALIALESGMERGPTGNPVSLVARPRRSSI